MELGRIGVWTTQLDYLPAAEARRGARRFEELGFSALWIGEAARREAFTNASLLLSATHRLIIATGIANIWARDAMTMANAHRTLAEAYPERFLLGLGVSHAPLVEIRGHDYTSPYTAMIHYLDAMDRARYEGAAPRTEPKRVLAALGPKMLTLAKKRAHGAHPYFVPVEHTRRARELLGKGPLLAPEQAIIVEEDPEKARRIARFHTRSYLRLPNYRHNLERLGYSSQDMLDGGSDRLVDAVVAWGSPNVIRERIAAHLRAGADHVCVQLLSEDVRRISWEGYEATAEVLLDKPASG